MALSKDSFNKKIGLFGFGCVAQGFYKGLKKFPELRYEVKTICVKDENKSRDADSDLFTTDPNKILEDTEIDVIVELIDDADFAKVIANICIENRIPLVSANKKMIAENLVDFSKWFKQTSSPFLYEGAVGGSIPILQTIHRFFQSQRISKIRGILNGSTNYILTQMGKANRTFEEALNEAQELGFAESDPYLDISGQDILYKTIILGYHAFNEILDPGDIFLEGITALDVNLVIESRIPGKKLKLISEIENTSRGLVARIEPVIITEDDELYNVDYEYNAISIYGDLTGCQTYIGKGAGSYPTGSAVLNDLFLISKKFKYDHSNPYKTLKRSA